MKTVTMFVNNVAVIFGRHEDRPACGAMPLPPDFWDRFHIPRS